ncbi:MAG: 3-oxoacyl-ACP synthase III family protein, partial [Candidatus Thorarchaeota archaeon]
MNRYAFISGIGIYVPKKVLTNKDLEKLLQKDGIDDWLVKNVGIKQRHIMDEKEDTSDLAVEASKEALSSCGISPDKIDLIILSTDTPDYVSPATSTVIQYKLGAKNAGTFDVNSACAGFVTALSTGFKYIETDSEINHVLVVGAYGMTRFVNWKDHYTATLFADGAGAFVLQSSTTKKGLLASKFIANGQYHDYLGIYVGGTAEPPTIDSIESQKHYVSFRKRFPAELNSETWPKLINDTLKKAHLSSDDIDYYFFTQLNLRTIETVMNTLNQPMTKTHTIMDKWGYTGSACIPMAMYDAIKQKKLPKLSEGSGERILLCSSGGGY